MSITLENKSMNIRNEFHSYLQAAFGDSHDEFKTLSKNICFQKSFSIKGGADRISFMSYIENEALIKEITSLQSDLIQLDEEANKRITKLWKNTVKSNDIVSADILFAGTISMMDCEIYSNVIDERVRIVIFDDYSMRIKRMDGVIPTVIGVMIFPIKIRNVYHPLIIPLGCQNGNDHIIVSTENMGYIRISPEERRLICEEIEPQILYQSFIHRLIAWYGVQLSLLHPLLQTVYLHGNKEKASREYDLHSYESRKRIRYVKKHIIDLRKIDDVINNKKNFHRKTLAWYVIGHWRYKGQPNQIFIKGYWKGPLRELNDTDGITLRHRIIDDYISEKKRCGI